MAYCDTVPSHVIPARTEGGPEYIDLNYDPADELSGMAPWDPAYVPPDPPVALYAEPATGSLGLIDPSASAQAPASPAYNPLLKP